MSVILFILGLALFIGLVVVHEFGHFIAARRNGVVAEEFGIFFPPRLYKRRMKGGWDFTINLLPLGGFVKLKGEHDTDTEPGSFGAASLWAKTQIMAAGVVMNLVVGVVLLAILAAIGLPQLIPNQYSVKSDIKSTARTTLVGYIEPGSPAQKAGLQSTDKLISIQQPGYSPVSLTDTKKLPDITKGFAGQEVKVTYERDSKIATATTKLLSAKTVQDSRKTDNPKGYLGIIPTNYTVQSYGWSSPVVALGLTKQITVLTFQGLGKALAGVGGIIAGAVTGNTTARENGQTQASSQVSGPLAIWFILQSGSDIGFQYMLFIIAIISLSLAIMNILPIPALDGGRLWSTLFFRGILKRPLSNKAEERLNAAGAIILITLIILITVVDAKRFL